MGERLTVSLEPEEFEALSRLAERELRPISLQARHIIRQALIEAGLLTAKGGRTWQID